MFESYKNRSIDPEKEVLVYKNLHKNKFSIKQDGLVVGHAKSITLKEVGFKVNQTGRRRVLKDKVKNVHAFVVGYLTECRETAEKGRAVTYNPYKYESFVFKDTESMAVVDSDQVLHCCSDKGLHIQSLS